MVVAARRADSAMALQVAGRQAGLCMSGGAGGEEPEGDEIERAGGGAGTIGAERGGAGGGQAGDGGDAVGDVGLGGPEGELGDGQAVGGGEVEQADVGVEIGLDEAGDEVWVERDRTGGSAGG